MVMWYSGPILGVLLVGIIVYGIPCSRIQSCPANSQRTLRSTEVHWERQKNKKTKRQKVGIILNPVQRNTKLSSSQRDHWDVHCTLYRKVKFSSIYQIGQILRCFRQRTKYAKNREVIYLILDILNKSFVSFNSILCFDEMPPHR